MAVCVFCLFHRAALEENAYNRMKKVVKWYLSGFYKKPKVTTYVIFTLVIMSSFRAYGSAGVSFPL